MANDASDVLPDVFYLPTLKDFLEHYKLWMEVMFWFDVLQCLHPIAYKARYVQKWTMRLMLFTLLLYDKYHKESYSLCRPYSSVSNKCNLCLFENFVIICKRNLCSLNKRNELASSCPHRNRYLLKNFKKHAICMISF